MKKGSKVIRDAAPAAPMFITWGSNETIPSSNIFKNNAPIFRAGASSNIVREGMTRRDYDAQRPNEAVETEIKKIISQSMWAYKNVGLLHNVVDLMSDFACQGIEIVHPNRKIEKFLQEWGRMVGFDDRSERFTNLLLRTGNVVVQKSHAKLKQKDIDNIERGVGEADVEVEPVIKIPKNEIPYGYVLHSPLNIEVLGGDDLAAFTGKVNYALRIPGGVLSKIKNPKSDEHRALIKTLPSYITDAVRAGKKLIPLNPEKVAVFHYKKDDWEAWADPISRPILKNLMMLEKLQLADMAALDGAISHVRLWRLGSLEHKIYPTEAAVARLADMLASAVGGGAIDIIWGPELDVEETSTEIYKFLGIEKYAPTLIAIYDGLGIPLALTGYASKGGLTNNFLSLKTLTQRLEYVRNILIRFWQAELKAVQQALGFRLPASIRFTRMTLTDEAAEKALLVQLADRNLISIETLQERFGEIPELELLRQNREERERKSGRRMPQAGQWFDALHEQGLQKIALQSGQVTPSEVGLNLKDRKPGEKSVVEHDKEKTELQLKARTQLANKKTTKGPVGQGRPKGKKDSQKRIVKKRTIQKTRAEFANAYAWTQNIQKSISDMVNKAFLASEGKKTMRSASDEQTKNIENLKFALLCNLKLYNEVNEQVIANFLIREEPLTMPFEISELYKHTNAKFIEKFDREPDIDEVRQIQASVFALYHMGDNDGES